MTNSTMEGVSTYGNASELRSQRSSMSSVDPDKSSLAPAAKKDGIAIEKKVGLLGSISLVVGVIIGSGIFISPRGVAVNAGSVGLSLLVWGIGGIIATIGSLCMAELGTLLPTSGGEYIYLRLALAEWVGFIWMWCACILLRPAATAIVVLTSAEYLLTPFFDDSCGPPPIFYRRMMAASLMLLIASINVWSVRTAAGIQVIFTVAKILALVIIIVGGIVRLIQGYTDNLATGFENTNNNGGEVVLAFYSAMFSYEGWVNLNSVAGEVINPAWTMPMAMYIGMPLVTVLYVLANVSYFTVMSVEELIASPAVAITWAETVLPKVPWLIPLSVALSTFGAANGSLFTVGRVFYAAAKRGDMLKVFSYIHVKNVTPMPAIVVSTALTIVYTLVGQIGTLLDAFSFTGWLFIFIIMLALVVMRYREPYKSMKRPYKVPLVLPIIVMIFAMTLVIVPMVLAPQVEFALSLVVIGIGFALYIPFVLFRVKVPCMDDVTRFFQVFFEIVPPSNLDSDLYIFKKDE